MTAREAEWKALSNIASSPFSRKLQDARLPSRVKHGTFVLYETDADPVAHIQHYQQLGPRSIRGWVQLAEEFTARFLTSRRAPKTFESLSIMKQEEDEPIRSYAKKYWETFNESEGCSEEYAIAMFKTGLPVRGGLRKSLNMSPVRTLAKLMERIE
ncbi:uncharacterized protein LOC131303018 [Rhododendron vialii]|uniref:uncharacterized protein LOC131303018 n=1 Tax=Rhododendron vialii TaxID=182163 RepID=UPI00265E406F|nr:uncharacterized protein LOC131303018 [Rhododendron vialii]